MKRKRDYMRKIEPPLLLGGLTYKEIVEYFELRKAINQRLAQDPKLIEADRSVEAGITYVTTGLKPWK